MAVLTIRDLRVEDGNLVWLADGDPEWLEGDAAVRQDILHGLVASGLLSTLVGLSSAESASTLAHIARQVETDSRVQTGSAKAAMTAAGQVEITCIINGTTVTL